MSYLINPYIIRPPLVTNNLMIYLDAKSSTSYPGSGTIWYDISGNSNNGTLISSPTYSSAYGGAFAFNGSTQYVDLVDCGYTDITVILSFMQTSSKALELFGTTTIVSSSPHSAIHFDASGIGAFSRFISAAGDRPHVRATGTGSPLSYNVPTIFTGTYNSSTNTSSIYKDGNFISSSTTTINSSSFQGNFGGNATAYAFNGSAYAILVYNRALSASEILQNYNSLRVI